MSDARSGIDAVMTTAGLTKRYGEIVAVDEVALEVRKGEIYGFLGLNGAGKTTTIRMLLGLVAPTGGEIRIFGMDPLEERRAVLGRIGFLVESASAYPNLTVRENLEIQRRLTGAPRGSVEEAMALLGLEGSADRRAGRLSLGNRQRLSLARALVHSPELLVLDEPANGLDPAGIVEIRRLLRRLADERGATVFMSSHLLAEVDLLADRIGVVHRGRLVEELDHDELASLRRTRLELTVGDEAEAAAILGDRFGASAVRRLGDGRLSVEDPRAAPEEVARAIVEAGIALKRLAPVEEGLEAHFMRVTGGSA